MTATVVAGIHHVALTVTDAPASATWYHRVLGFEVQRQWQVGTITKVMLAAPGLSLVLADHGSQAVPGDFDEHRDGLDHLSFAVADRAALEAWAALLDEHHVPRSAVTRATAGSLIAFRDPDNIALELYTLASE